MTEEGKVDVVRNATDLQRLKLEKLMKNPEKPVFIPDKSKEKNFPSAPEFVRNVMGSSAGAGSGEFHVYRHIRRREYARQEFLNQLTEKEKLDLEYREKLEQNRLQTEQKTAKKRAKRQRAKQRMKDKKRGGGKNKKEESSSGEEEEEESDEDSQEKKEKSNDRKKEEEDALEKNTENTEPKKKSLKELLLKANLSLPLPKD